MDYNNYKIKYLSLKNELEGGLFVSMGTIAKGVGNLGKGVVKGLAASTESVANVTSRKAVCLVTKDGQDEIKNAFDNIYEKFPKILLVIFAKIYNPDKELILSTGKISYDSFALSKQNRLKNNITLVLESLRSILENNYLLNQRSIGSLQSIDDIKTVANFIKKNFLDSTALNTLKTLKTLNTLTTVNTFNTLTTLKTNLELILNKIDCLCKSSFDSLEKSQLTTLEQCLNNKQNFINKITNLKSEEIILFNKNLEERKKRETILK